MFKVAIIGGQNRNNYTEFESKCIYYLSRRAKNKEPIIILTTGDKLVEKFCQNLAYRSDTSMQTLRHTRGKH